MYVIDNTFTVTFTNATAAERMQPLLKRQKQLQRTVSASPLRTSIMKSLKSLHFISSRIQSLLLKIHVF